MIDGKVRYLVTSTGRRKHIVREHCWQPGRVALCGASASERQPTRPLVGLCRSCRRLYNRGAR